MKKTSFQEMREKVKNLPNDLFTTASEIRIGDNVWEHNIITSIVKSKNKIVFNSETICRWEATPDTRVMITARIPNENDLWCSCKGEDKNKCFEIARYISDGECDKCPVEKHHYHGGICGKIVQIG